MLAGFDHSELSVARVIRRGVPCLKCETVYFPGRSDRVTGHPSSPTANFAQLHCTCGEITSFDIGNLQLYRVSESAYMRGHASAGEWEEIQEPSEVRNF